MVGITNEAVDGFIHEHDLAAVGNGAVDSPYGEINATDRCKINSVVHVFDDLLQFNSLGLIVDWGKLPPGCHSICRGWVIGDVGGLQSLEDEVAHSSIITSEAESDCKVLVRSPEIVLEVLLDDLGNFRVAETSKHFDLLHNVLLGLTLTNLDIEFSFSDFNFDEK